MIHPCSKFLNVIGSTTASLVAILALAGPAQAGPSQKHFGAFPQGQSGKEGANYSLVDQNKQHEDSSERASGPEPDSATQCPTDGRHYRKSLLITAFARREQAGANAGGLWGAEQALPELLGAELAEGTHLTEYQLLNRSLPDQATHLSQQVRQLSRETGKQLVLSGELYDLGMARPKDSLDPGLLTRTRNAAVSTLRPKWDTRQRDFVLQLTLFDGMSGNPVHTLTHQLQGAWNPKRPERARFGTPAFWQTDYGRAIKRAIASASEEVNEAIRCQPLVARLESGQPGAPRLLHAGQLQGLQPGDRLPLHRISHRAIPGAYRKYSAHLLDSGVRLMVEATYPHYSEVRVEGEETLHGEHMAVTPAQAPGAMLGYAGNREPR